MKKILLTGAILLGLSNFAFKNLNSKQKNNAQIQFTTDSYTYNTSYTHTWDQKYDTSRHRYHESIDSSNTYYAGKWSKYAENWNEFTRKYNYFAFTNNSSLLLEYENHTYGFSTNKNNFWKQTTYIREYISGKNNNITFQINTGVLSTYEASLTLEVWYTTDGDIYFKWNFKLKGNDIFARVVVHLPQIRYYFQQN